MRNSTNELIAKYEAHIALMKLEDGTTQFEHNFTTDGSWIDCSNPTTPIWRDMHHCEYRVKPKPIELWAWKYPSSGKMGQDFYSKKQPDDTGSTGRVMVLLREVTE